MHPLAKLLTKQTESTILGYLAVSPLRGHSAHELSKRLRMSPQKAKAGLSSLAAESWLKSAKRGDKEFFYYNLKHGPASQLRQALTKNKPAPQDELMVAIKKLGQVKAAFLSGVFTGHPELPCDILIVGKTKRELVEEFMFDCQKLLGCDINYSTMTEEEFKERRSVLDRFLRELFDNPYLTIVDNL